MTANPFAALLDGLPRYDETWTGVEKSDDGEGEYIRFPDILAALAAAVPADLAEAGKVLEWLRGIKTADGFEHTQEEGVNVLKLKRKPDPRGSEAADLITALLARIAAQEAVNKGLEATIERFARAHERHLIAGAETRARAEAAETALAAMTKERDGLRESLQDWQTAAQADYTALAASEARVSKLVEAARDAEYDLLQWLECGEHLTKAGFNMDGTPEVVRNLTAALREFQEKSNAKV